MGSYAFQFTQCPVHSDCDYFWSVGGDDRSGGEDVYHHLSSLKTLLDKSAIIFRILKDWWRIGTGYCHVGTCRQLSHGMMGFVGCSLLLDIYSVAAEGRTVGGVGWQHLIMSISWYRYLPNNAPAR
jgi:hypothetical protein